MGFKEQGFDESGYATAVARHLKTDHQNLSFKPKDLLELITDFDFYFEPARRDVDKIRPCLYAVFNGIKGGFSVPIALWFRKELKGELLTLNEGLPSLSSNST